MLNLDLFWNLFLAVIPVVAAYLLVWVDRRISRTRRGVALASLGSLWLAFLPNSCYLMTEWRHFLFNPHFQAIRAATNPNDLSVLRVAKHAIFFLGYSGFGVLCFVMAIRPVVRLMKRYGFRPARFAPPFYFAVALGVYLGLILRLNSWDLVADPLGVLNSSIRAILNPPLLAVMIAFAGVLALLYELIDIWFDGLSLRISRYGNASRRLVIVPASNDTRSSL